ncbi:gliding motility-associated protein GldE [Aureispira anguillae]|uniref:Gliding motility-associated protein GldE n=1 Tax=Aureispira anguillae TaxID=2864201 RepID=A0A916DWL1_9BACT|nr:gliding motility-associated protein GldE [Aureispira anguillae]BDS14141.1 gliding motility-associated protein GldE [Aureispira anguillae]
METEPSHIFDWYQFTPIFLTGSYSGIILNTFSICILLICSGLLSGSEVAFFSLGHQDRAQLIEEQSSAAARILNLLSKPRYLLSTILIANNIINIAIILVSNSLLKQLLPVGLSEYVNFFITVVVVTFLLVLFGEVAPKVYANQNNMRIARFMSSPLLVMQRLFTPLSWILVNSTQLVERRLRTKLNQSTVSQEDIASAIELTVKDNKYAEQDVDILKGIIRFGNTSAAEIMKPRMKVVALDIESTFEELINVFKEEPYSRIPIYEEDLDQVKGIIHAKDLLEHINQGNDMDWHELIRPPLITPEKKKIDDLFNDFQEKRTHMAIVVDEYGGTKGIVTMEDILEEIVGEILDEFDDVEEQIYTKIDEYTYDFDGSTPIIEICRVLDLRSDFFDDIREGAETIAGLVLVLNGSIPKLNVPVLCKDCQLITLAASLRRIEKIRLVLPQIDNIDLSPSVSEKN